MKNRKIYYTCSLCHHFDGNKEECSLKKISTFAVNKAFTTQCIAEGSFIRNLNVQYAYANFYNDEDLIPTAYIEDLSKLPTDANGVPLFVLTKAGIERAIPAYEGLELVSDNLMGVRREFTYQGQRELIYELGVDLARKVCKALGINLVVLSSEENSMGFDEYKAFSKIY